MLRALDSLVHIVIMIDNEIHTKLRAEFNPDGSDVRTLQMECLAMLKEIDRICAKHNIKYILSSGTLLGAIRHGGFIPWDDDLDVEMLKGEYKRLLKVLPKELDPKFVVHSRQNDPHYIFNFIKIREKQYEVVEPGRLIAKYNKKGIFIDIFVMNQGTKFNSVLSKYIWRFLLSSPMTKLGLPGVYSIVVGFMLFNVLFPILDISNHFFGKDIRHGLGSRFTETRKKEHFTDIIKVEFEGSMFNAPADYEGYLTEIYGDYMAIPEVKQTHLVGIKKIADRCEA